MAFPSNWEQETDPVVLMNATANIETQIRADIEAAVTQLRNLNMGDEQIFDVITLNMGGNLTENQMMVLAHALGIA